jgi:hypothetical protein
MYVDLCIQRGLPVPSPPPPTVNGKESPEDEAMTRGNKFKPVLWPHSVYVSSADLKKISFFLSVKYNRFITPLSPGLGLRLQICVQQPPA